MKHECVETIEGMNWFEEVRVARADAILVEQLKLAGEAIAKVFAVPAHMTATEQAEWSPQPAKQ